MSEENLDKDESKYWYNEIPPDVYFNLHQIKSGRAPLFQKKWQREIQDQQLDVQQRQILREQRLGRIYLNPTFATLKPKRDKKSQEMVKELATFQRNEEAQSDILWKRRINETCSIYGVSYREVGGTSEQGSEESVFSTRGRFCQKLRRLPPFDGPHALHLLPWEATRGQPKRDRFQVKVFRDKVYGHQLLDKESKNVKQYATTPQAVWRQHRFSSPDGCSFKDIKEQTRVAKYMAMLKVQEMKERVAVGHAKLTSHFKPWNQQRDADPDCEDFFQDQALMAKAKEDIDQKMARLKRAQREAIKESHLARRQTSKSSPDAASSRPKEAISSSHHTMSSSQMEAEEENVRAEPEEQTRKESVSRENKQRRKGSLQGGQKTVEGQQSAMLESGSVKNGEKVPAPGGVKQTVVENKGLPPLKNKPVFSVEGDFLEDLQAVCRESRKELSKSLTPQPVGNFYPDPRPNPKYAPCFKKDKTFVD